MKKQLLLLFATLALCGSAQAYSFAVANEDGDMLYYNINNVAEGGTPSATLTYDNITNHHYGGTINIPASVDWEGVTYAVTAIGSEAFYACQGLTRVQIPSSVTIIGMAAFSGCYNLVDLTIPSSVTTICDQAFISCNSITTLNLPSSVVTIGDEAFSYCNLLSTVTLPNYLTSIGQDAFKNSPWYNTASQWESGVRYAGTYLLAARNSLAGSYTVKAGTTCVANGAFYQCGALTSVTWPATVHAVGKNTFTSCTSLTSVSLPTGITTIGENAFKFCTALTSMVLPDSVTAIGEDAFYGCDALTTLTLSSALKTLDDDVFARCTALTELRCRAVVPPTARFLTFSDMDTTIPLYVPCHTAPAYETATYWSAFDNIYEDCSAIGDTPDNDAPAVTLWPNPTTCSISLATNETAVRMEAYDAAGHCVTIVEHANSIDLSSLPSGIYTLRITLPDGTAVRKVVKQ